MRRALNPQQLSQLVAGIHTMAENKDPKQLQAQYTQYQDTLRQLQSNLSEFTSKIQEYAIVDASLARIPPEKRKGRKCFKMIGGVLVEKDIDEVSKILHSELAQMQTKRNEQEKKLTSTKKEFDEWITKNNVKVMRPEDME